MDLSTKEKLTKLRELMRSEKISATVIPSSDPHMSEYLPEHWHARQWFSGFTGSAGTLVVTLEKAGLWTDSRYFIQANTELKDSGIDLYKEGLIDTPNIPTFLNNSLSSNDTVSIYGEITSIATLTSWREQLPSIRINTKTDLITPCWIDRPSLPQSHSYIYEEKFAGESALSKIEKVRKTIAEQQVLLVTALDEIAWILNIRGEEIKNNPVVISYLLIDKTKTTLFIDPKKVNIDLLNYFKTNNIQVKEYHEVFKTLSRSEDHILIDPRTANVKLQESISDLSKIIFKGSPIPLLKAKRNNIEIRSLKSAMLKDGIALTKFLIWLEENLKSEKITEIDISNKLYELRSTQPLFKGESFDTIAGYKEHGAIVHYKASPATNATLNPKGFLLVDSGAQYLDGTTDITRTIALGELSDEEKTDYTAVLKGHINLAKAIFPQGTRGSQLDILARLPLWEMKKNFLHGTGHGVGQFLCVHEGPQSIRMNENPITMQLGMLTSNEPGIYIEGSHGIRIENLMLVENVGEGLFSDYYKFETVTLCPICTKGIVKENLSKEEISWLNAYHQNVYSNLAPHLNEKEQRWLEQATAKI